jgi:hypothetical protein
MGTAGARGRRNNRRANNVRNAFHQSISSGNLKKAVNIGINACVAGYSTKEIAAAVVSARVALKISKTIINQSKGDISGGLVSKAVGETLKDIGKSTRTKKVDVSARVRQSIRPSIVAYFLKEGRK